jgi:hypothetical protein
MQEQPAQNLYREKARMSAATHPPPSQWLFPLLALQETPSVTTSNYSAQKELYDRGRGVEFLFRLGSSLGLYDKSSSHRLREFL